MIKNKIRSFKIGASDTHFVMSNWETTTFLNWWQIKLAIKNISFANKYTLAGTYKEHQLADWYAQKHNIKIVKDRQIKKTKYLIVNLDFETKQNNIEVKTHKTIDKEWVVPKDYWQQVQVQTYVCKKPTILLSYVMKEEDYDNFFLLIDETRIQEISIDYDKNWIENEYLPREKYLEWCLKNKKLPNKKEFERRINNYGTTI